MLIGLILSASGVFFVNVNGREWAGNYRKLCLYIAGILLEIAVPTKNKLLIIDCLHVLHGGLYALSQ